MANGVPLTAIGPDGLDTWDGFPAARRRLLASLGQAGNPVVLSGDIHKHVASELLHDFDEPERGNVGVELISTSIASGGDGSDTDGGAPRWEQHDYVKFYRPRRGYVHVTLTAEQMSSTFVTVPWIEADDTAPREVAARFLTPAGTPVLRQEEQEGR